LSRQTLDYTAGVIRRDRRQIGAPWRKLNPGRRLDEARLAFEKMLTYANHVGLYAEQISRAGQQQGNFPRR
jgi:hypothetical protein